MQSETVNLIETKNLVKTYGNTKKHAVDNACVTLKAGETIGLFGESGSGKSTFGMMAAGLLKPSKGDILYDGQSVKMPFKGKTRNDIQILFQHPEVSFNPVLPLSVSMKEPFRLKGLPLDDAAIDAHVRQFGLTGEHLKRIPSELSGGELQRAALARILVLKPRVIVLDEPTSMLDVITQAQIMEMLKEYQQEHGTAYILITHNEALCKKMCNRIYKVEKGKFTLAEEES